MKKKGTEHTSVCVCALEYLTRNANIQEKAVPGCSDTSTSHSVCNIVSFMGPGPYFGGAV